MRRLVIAPHVDDDVLGCASVLDENAVVLYCGVDPFHVVDDLERLREATAVRELTGHRFIWPSQESRHGLAGVIAWHEQRRPDWEIISYRTDRAVNQYDQRSLIIDIEAAVNELRPDEVYVPEWYSYNQDHATVFNAAEVALRPHDQNFFVPRVLAYEQPHVFMWGDSGPDRPTYFRELVLGFKIQLYHAMASQVRGHRSEATIAALARLRGAASGFEVAEGFRVLRWVEGA